MKIKLVITMFILLFMQTLSAQLRIGPKAGVNIVKIDGVSFSDQFRYGYHLGGFIEAVITKDKKLSIQPEVIISQVSTTLDSNYKSIYQNIFSSNQSSVKLNYLSFPILFNYKLIGPVYLQAGPQFSVLMNQDRNFLQNGEEAFKNGDFAMIGGAQVRISKIYVTGRYVIGLNNINDIDNRDKWKNQAIQISLGLSL